MNILIIGGAGYIGSHVSKYLSKKGENVVVLDNLSRGHKELAKWGKFVQGDFSDKVLLKKVFKDEKIDAVMHFSAFAYVGESVTSPAIYYDNNVVKTIALLDCMVESGVNNFIFSSSCATFGEAKYLPIDENHPQNPINPYGFTKYVVEKVLADYAVAYGLRSSCLRYFNAAGADPDGETGEWHDPETHLIPLVIDAALGKRKNITVFGTDYATPDGTCVRDYVHIMDLAQAHFLALKHIIKTGKSVNYNLGNGNGFSVKQIIEIVEKVSGKKVPVVYGERRAGDPAMLVGSSKKIRDELNYKPEFDDIETIISTAWRWHTSQN